jgi:hypothetical protein
MASEILTAGMDADHEIIRRSQNQTFAAQMNQNLGFSLRCGQKMERGVDEIGVEESIGLRPFDGVSSNYLVNNARVQTGGVLADSSFLFSLIKDALAATPSK